MAGDGDAGGDRYGGLIGTTLLAATPDDPEVPGTWTLVESDVLSVLMDEDEAGLLSPVFTSAEALARWRPEGGCYVAREASWLFRVATADPEGRVVVDPGSPASVVLAPAEVAALAEDRSPAEAVGAPVLIATPDRPLAAPVADGIEAALAREPSVRSARLFLFDQTGEGPQPMVMVDLAPGLGEAGIGEVMQRVVTGIGERTDQAGGLTFTVVTEEWRSTFESGGLVLFER
ncbi:MAG TPA: SseB family protein [Acidimicrobiales bacterium]|nr:SseB family protein [Acidimicrobiales bacterium]